MEKLKNQEGSVLVKKINEIIENINKQNDVKPILLYKVNVRGKSHHRSKEILINFINMFKNENYEQIFIPVVDSDTNVECIYPKMDLKILESLNDLIKSYKDLDEELEKEKISSLTDLINNIFNEKENGLILKVKNAQITAEGIKAPILNLKVEDLYSNNYSLQVIIDNKTLEDIKNG